MWIYLIIVIALVILDRLFKPSDETKSAMYLSSEEIENFDTGDLIFSSYPNLLGKFMNLWTGSRWSHVGMILRDKSQKSKGMASLYVMETANYTHISSKYKGIIVIPLEKWININKNCGLGYMRLNCPENFNRQILGAELKKIQDLKLDTKGMSFYKFIKLGFNQDYDSKEFKTSSSENPTCYELVVMLYQNSKIAKKRNSPGSYTANNLLEGKLPLNSDFIFDEPVELILE
jgi:hypothetical protein